MQYWLCLGLCLLSFRGLTGHVTKAQADDSVPKSWTDPRVLEQLEKSCTFDPDKIKNPEERKSWLGDLGAGDPSALSCEGEFDQSCVYDPCYDTQEKQCKPRCRKTCRTCSSACVAPCETCKRACHDATCRKSCALTCAQCHQACVRAGDRCSTGTCTQEYKQCRATLKKNWLRNGCPQVCEEYIKAQKVCEKGDSVDWECMKRIKPKQNHGCDVALCQGPWGMGINPVDD